MLELVLKGPLLEEIREATEADEDPEQHAVYLEVREGVVQAQAGALDRVGDLGRRR